jgi:hypothetical protein
MILSKLCLILLILLSSWSGFWLALTAITTGIVSLMLAQNQALASHVSNVKSGQYLEQTPPCVASYYGAGNN